MSWHLLTGEYAPKMGGVADYSLQIAQALRESGADVHVWCPADANSAERVSVADGPVIQAIPGLRGLLGCLRVGQRLGAGNPNRMLLIQYVPHGWGCHAMNVGFCLWLLWRSRVRGDQVRVMFHEVAMPFTWRPLRYNIQAVVHRLMAVILLAASRRTYVSTPAFGRLLSRLSLGYCVPTWLPVPSNIPRIDDPAAVQTVRDRIIEGTASACIVGHFGTFGGGAGTLLLKALLLLLASRRNLHILLLGSGALQFRSTLLVQVDVGNRSRIHAQESLWAAAMSVHLQACDLMLQPYPDGVTTRRSTAMAAMANGVPLVTNLGPLSEPLWAESSFAALATAPDSAALAHLTETILDNNLLKDRLRVGGMAFYRQHFTIEQSIATLQN